MAKTAYYPLNGFRVCVDSVDSDAGGTAYSPLSKEPIPFGNIGELLIRMDSLFDKAGYPQSFEEKRRFDETTETGNRYHGLPERRHTAEHILAQRGAAGTFDIRIDSRRNTSWQGTLTDLTTGASSTFLGDMELLHILVGAGGVK